MEPIPRVSARVLPVSPDGEVLLLQDRDPAERDVLRWGTIGGAVDPGESLEEAAVREMHEETGLIDPADLTPPADDLPEILAAAVAAVLGAGR